MTLFFIFVIASDSVATACYTEQPCAVAGIVTRQINIKKTLNFKIENPNSEIKTMALPAGPGFTLQVLALPYPRNPARAVGFPLQSLTLPAHRAVIM
jgi:hypothetical protein